MFGRRKRQPTILVMESSHLVRKLLTLLLERQGARVLCVETVDGALNALYLDETPSLVLTGLKTADQDGLGLIHAMRSKPDLATIPIVAMASPEEEHTCRIALAMGASGYLPKPFTVQAVAHIFQEYCRTGRPARKKSSITIGILSDCDLQRHQLKHVLTTNGYEVAINCRPQQMFQFKASEVQAVRLWLIDQPEHDDNEFLMQIAEDLNGAVLFGIGRAPVDPNGIEGHLFMQWERRLLNKIEVSLYGRVITRSSEYVGGAHREVVFGAQTLLIN